MSPEPRTDISQVSDAVHGALDFTELEVLGLDPETIVDFSVNGNPYGPSPLVREALTHVLLDRYPDRESLALRRALALHLGVTPEHIIVGNGSSELLWLSALAFLRPGDAVVIVGPTFGEYARAATLMGAHVHACTAQAETLFRIQPEAVSQTLRDIAPRVVFLCNPNNPTGVLLSLDTIATWALQAPQTLFVVDEAYLPFTRQASSILTRLTPNMVVLHSMTKAHALAGLRLGYAVGVPDVVRVLTRVRPPWNVNALAQAAGVAALHDTPHLTRTLAQVAQAKQAFVAGLQALGLEPVPSATHFFLVPVANAMTLRHALLRRGFLVRDCASFGLPTYVRLATRLLEDNKRLLTALAEVL